MVMVEKKGKKKSCAPTVLFVCLIVFICLYYPDVDVLSTLIL